MIAFGCIQYQEEHQKAQSGKEIHFAAPHTHTPTIRIEMGDEETISKPAYLQWTHSR